MIRAETGPCHCSIAAASRLGRRPRKRTVPRARAADNCRTHDSSRRFREWRLKHDLPAISSSRVKGLCGWRSPRKPARSGKLRRWGRQTGFVDDPIARIGPFSRQSSAEEDPRALPRVRVNLPQDRPAAFCQDATTCHGFTIRGSIVGPPASLCLQPYSGRPGMSTVTRRRRVLI